MSEQTFAFKAAQFRWHAGEADRVSLLPIRHQDIWEYRKLMEALRWNAQEVDLSLDKSDWEKKMTEEQRQFVRQQLAFFAGADLWVLDNIADNFGRELDCMEAAMVFTAQEDQECVHAESYGLQIEAVLDGEERDRTLNAVRHMPVIARIRDWTRQWMGREVPVGERLIAWAIFEGVFFSASFAALQWLRELNLLPGVTNFNTLIARDEGVHTLHLCLQVRKYLVDRPAQARAREIFNGAVAILDEFVEHALPVRLIGINANLMKDYVRFQSDCVLRAMDYEPIFGAENPFPFMDKLSLNGVAKTNFFEHRALQYASPVHAGATRFVLDDTPVD
jgi:ribonucleoside-diphosphate reductase beta chain